MNVQTTNRFFDDLRISGVWLRVLNLGTVAAFYRDIIGLKETGRAPQFVRMSASGQEPAQIVLFGDPGAQPRKRSSPGLFHTAFLLPSRTELARTLRHIGESGWRFQGFADHGVSEAAYLADPEGNGIELYRDRQKDEWPRENSGVAMVTEALDVQALMEELPETPNTYEGIHPDTMIGHIHLQISSLEKAEEFYRQVVGLDVTQRDYPGALFLSANGYHHHIGLNIWNSGGALPAPGGSTGLMSFGIIANPSRVEGIMQRAGENNLALQKTDTGILRLLDPNEIPFDVSVL